MLHLRPRLVPSVPVSRAFRVVLGATLLAGLSGGPAAPAAAASNPIVLENQQPGTGEWEIPNSSGTRIANDTQNQIKGYPSSPSVNKGENITFYVTVNTPQTYTIEFYRLGWYGGLGGRFMQRVGPFAGVKQAACPVVEASTNLIACNWTPGYTLTVPTTWTDGIFVAVLTNANKYQNYVPFLVRDDARVAPLLYQQPVFTYQAYNSWGGKSLYAYNSSGGNRAYKVSFDRPYEGDGSADVFAWEIYQVQWMEQNGYDVTYTTNLETHRNASRLLNYRGFLSPGHDEYYSKEMFDAVQNARDAGVNLAFFGSNPVYWQIRLEPSAAGVPDRVVVCYKTSEAPNPTDPITATNPSLTTTQWRAAPVNRAEQALVGVQFTSQTGDDWDATKPYIVTNSSHWVYAGTGLAEGASIPKIVGYEADRQFSQFPLPAGSNYTLLSRSPYVSVDGTSDIQNASIYQAPSGAWVFASGTMSWAWALKRPTFVNAGLQKATANILAQFIANAPQPTPTATATATSTPPPAPSAYRSAVLADSPAGYWRLGETSGTAAADQQGSNPGAYEGGPALGQAGGLSGDADKAVSLNGTSQQVSVPYNASLNSPVFSAEVWAYPTGGAGTYRGAIGDRFYPRGWVLYASASNIWEFWINNGTGIAVISGGSVTLNAWSHVVGTFDGTTARLYVNGVLQASAPVSAGYTPQTTNPLVVGQGEPGSGTWFPGRLDEAAVYSGALTATQVQNHYSIGTTGAPPTPTPTATPTPTPPPSVYRPAVLADNPLGYWRLGETSGTTAADVQQAHSGTYVGSPTLGQPGALTGDTDKAVSLNGSSQQVSVPYSAALNTTTFSAEVWAFPTGGGGTYRGAMGSRFYPQGWAIYAGGSNVWEFWINSGAGMAAVSGGSVTLNAWSHVVGTFDGTTARLYVNGVQVASGNVSGYTPQAASPLLIGQSEPGTGTWFPGRLDEAAVYGTALTATQVQTHYAKGTTGQ